MALPSSFLDELRARTPIAAVVGRKTKLTRAGRQWKGCCPFHGEKTPSLYVYDDHFHCFGCGAHGDAISFVMQSEGAGFMEAVERLAGEAGLDVPKPVPDAAERRRLDLHGVLEAAAAPAISGGCWRLKDAPRSNICAGAACPRTPSAISVWAGQARDGARSRPSWLPTGSGLTCWSKPG